jgi:hypothetical protein
LGSDPVSGIALLVLAKGCAEEFGIEWVSSGGDRPVVDPSKQRIVERTRSSAKNYEHSPGRGMGMQFSVKRKRRASPENPLGQ